jgi:hypothetical protein
LDGRCVVFHGAVRQFFLVVLVFFIYVAVCVLDEGVVLFAPMSVMIALIVFDNVFLGRLLICLQSGAVFVIARGFVWGSGFFSAKKGLNRSFVFVGVFLLVKLLRIAVNSRRIGASSSSSIGTRGIHSNRGVLRAQ